ncbi:MAG: hypothetical protein KKD07_10565 [Candidatus Omnitrophica bacterium]|nr:hypothetical protein [Candidatus Omnitrophota bacterium]MBU1997681.1 hypothetical protein [Candidatus Omnitrophota bacterium]MBU4334872.1 hypothetical protein [Candidatus Omnitrophota bacterium]
MKKFLINVFFFFSLLFLVSKLIGSFDNIDHLYNSNHNIRRIRSIELFDDLDILFIGNSYTYAGINPEIFDKYGLKTYNLGIATAGPDFYDLILNDYFKRTRTKPQRIMILLSPVIFSNLADDWAAYPMHRYLKYPVSNENIILKYGKPGKYPGMLTKSLKKGFTNLILKNKNKMLQNFDIIDRKGFSFDDTVITDDLRKKNRHLYSSCKSDLLDMKDLDKLLALANLLKHQGIEVVFYELPANELNTFFTSDYLESYKKLVNSINNQFAVFRSNIELEQKYYRDLDHLNVFGAEIISENIISKLKIVGGEGTFETKQQTY